MRILLVCSAGLSTSLLVNNMKKYADPEDVIEAYPVARLEELIEKYDVVLCGPQIRYKMKDVQKIAEAYGKPVDVIDMLTYGQQKGDKAMELARKMMS